VAAVARRLGVAPATLRTWDRRYGLGPTLHSAGSHRRYSRPDIARLETMRRLVLDGVPPADAARLAVDRVSRPGTEDGPPPGPSGRLGPLDGVRPGGPGGRVLALPGGTAESRGLARAAMALDAGSIRVAVDRAVAEHGVIPTWTELLCPVLVAVGERWAATGEGVEVEHLRAETGRSAPRPSHATDGRFCSPARRRSSTACRWRRWRRRWPSRASAPGCSAAGCRWRRCGRRYAGPGRRR
jgi:DNA-binding transcriptional MerR regulator